MASRYWVGGTGTWNTTNTARWSTTSGGTGGASVPGLADTAIIDNNSYNGTNIPFTITVASGISDIRGLTISATTAVPTVNGLVTVLAAISLPSSGSAVLTGLSISASGLPTTFTGTKQIAALINSGIRDLTFLSNANVGAFTANGTISLGGFTVSATSVSITGASTINLAGGTLNCTGNVSVTNTLGGSANITFNGGSLIVGGNFASWNTSTFTTTAGTGTGKISMNSASAKAFNAGNQIFNCTLENAGAGALTISGSNTFTTISNSVQPTTFRFTSGSTQTVTNFNVSGVSGSLVTIDASTAGSAATLSKSSSTVSVSYCAIKDSTATGGATWKALLSNGNVNSGNNTGWDFGATGNGLFFGSNF